jgi:hypothetical protein
MDAMQRQISEVRSDNSRHHSQHQDGVNGSVDDQRPHSLGKIRTNLYLDTLNVTTLLVLHIGEKRCIPSYNICRPTPFTSYHSELESESSSQLDFSFASPTDLP